MGGLTDDAVRAAAAAAGGAPGSAAAATAAAAARKAALIDKYVATWPRGDDGRYLLHEDADFILIS